MTAAPSPSPAAFPRVLCGVNGSRGSGIAVKQALSLASPSGLVHLVAVTDTRGVGPTRMADLSEFRANRGLAAAKALARDRGIRCETSIVDGGTVADELLERAAGYDLLVVGSHHETRFGGIMTGSVATELVHRASTPLLVARRDDEDRSYPRSIVVAVEDRRHALRQVELASAIAEARGSSVRIVHVVGPDHDERTRRLLAELCVAVQERTGTMPICDELTGDPAHALVESVATTDTELLVVGHRGLEGLSAVKSVSEQVTHRAVCSVLVAAGE